VDLPLLGHDEHGPTCRRFGPVVNDPNATSAAERAGDPRQRGKQAADADPLPAGRPAVGRAGQRNTRVSCGRAGKADGRKEERRDDDRGNDGQTAHREH